MPEGREDLSQRCIDGWLIYEPWVSASRWCAPGSSSLRAVPGRADKRHLIKLMTDPYNAKKLAGNLLNVHGLPLEYVRQGYLSLSDATKTLHELIMARKIRHDGHPVLRWHASNAVARKDPAGNIKLGKEKSRKKIDGMAALVNAIAGAINNPPEPPSVYEHRGIPSVVGGRHGSRSPQTALAGR